MEFDEAELMTGTVSELVAAITSRPVEPGPDGRPAYVTTTPDTGEGRRAFGGLVVAQALHAATRTAPEGLDVHSLHGYFLRPVPLGSSSLHRVEHVRDGRSFSVREVSSEVGGRPAFRMTCSFHRPEAGDEYQLPVAPDIPSPGAAEGADVPFPFDIRELGATERRADGTFLSTRRCWFRSRERLPDDPALHACVLAYLSDMTGAAFRPLSLGIWGVHTDASLDHALWFHRPRRADEWNFFDLQALVNAGGRATVRGTMHGDDGTLYLSMAQELLIRELEVPVRAETPPWVVRGERPLESEREGADDGVA
ncbi:MAG: acyl-CoA thioesterase [Acidimicrobiales bacterium]